MSPPFDTDGNPSSFNPAEHEAIQNVFVQMAEDYAPFDVDVTTEEPLVDDLINQGDPDQRWGIRVVFGGSSSDWFGSAAGGLPMGCSGPLNRIRRQLRQIRPENVGRDCRPRS